MAAQSRLSAGGEWYDYRIRFIMFRAFDAMEFTIPCEYQGQLRQAVMEIRNGWIRMKGLRELTERERWATDFERSGYPLLDPRTTYDYETNMLIVKQP
ncbi:hypothetical protein [Bifidobacterium colobi]|nr:hypothetical protein [Bifidobacterium colobi]